MRDLCLDEGTLQSYCDGELEPEMLKKVESHLSSCSSCREAVQEVESEMATSANAFAAEMALSVPSERLRARLDEAIAGLRARPSLELSPRNRLRDWLGSFSSVLDLAPRRAIAFASVLALVVLVAIAGVVLMRQRGPESGLALVEGNEGEPAELVFTGKGNDAEPTANVPIVKTSEVRRVPRPRSQRTANTVQINAAHRMLPGEKNYLQAITLLTDAIEINGENSLKPTLLADYKRNLEVVNHAIAASQVTARTNPASPDAAEMLFAVYQSKLDLLSVVAEQTRPMIAQR